MPVPLLAFVGWCRDSEPEPFDSEAAEASREKYHHTIRLLVEIGAVLFKLAATDGGHAPVAAAPAFAANLADTAAAKLVAHACKARGKQTTRTLTASVHWTRYDSDE